MHEGKRCALDDRLSRSRLGVKAQRRNDESRQRLVSGHAREGQPDEEREARERNDRAAARARGLTDPRRNTHEGEADDEGQHEETRHLPRLHVREHDRAAERGEQLPRVLVREPVIEGPRRLEACKIHRDEAEEDERRDSLGPPRARDRQVDDGEEREERRVGEDHPDRLAAPRDVVAVARGKRDEKDRLHQGSGPEARRDPRADPGHVRLPEPHRRPSIHQPSNRGNAAREATRACQRDAESATRLKSHQPPTCSSRVRSLGV